MKKLFLSLLACFAFGTFASYAVDYYLVGAFNGWAQKDSQYKFTQSSTNSNLYTLDLGSTEFKSGFKIMTDGGTWYGSGTKVNTGSTSINTSLTISTSGNDIAFTDATKNILNAHFELNTSNWNLTITGTRADSAVDLYLLGEMNSWTANNDYKFSTSDYKNYTYSIASISKGVTFKIGSSDWAVSLTSNNKNMGKGEFTLISGGMNNDMAFGADITDVKFTVDVPNLKMTVEGNIAGESKTYTIYFDNSNAKWDEVWVYTWEPEVAGWPGVQLQQNEEGLYQWDYTSVGEPSFAGLNFNNGDKGKQTDNLTYEVNKTYTYGDTSVDPDPETDALYFVGDGKINGNLLGWTPTSPLTLTGDEGVYTFTVSAGTTFKVSSVKADWDSGFNGNGFCFDSRENSNVQDSDINNTINLYWGSAQDIVMPSSGTEYTVTMTVKGSVGGSSSTMLIQGEVTYPESIYLLGNTTPDISEWNPEDGVELVGTNGVYAGTVTLYPAKDSEYAYFSFATKKGTWDEVNQGVRYVTESGSDEEATQTGNKMKVGDDGAWHVKVDNPSSDVTLTVDLPNMTVKVDKVTGVTNIEAAEGEAVYFNLQGQKVANPDKGIYVKVVNGKAVKVIR